MSAISLDIKTLVACLRSGSSATLAITLMESRRADHPTARECAIA
jgi:hypothetical protein